MPSKLEQTFDEQRKEKFGLERLELSEPNPRGAIDLRESTNVTPSRHDARFRESIRQRYGMTQLDVVGLATTPEKKSLADYVTEQATIDRNLNGAKLATAQVQFKGAPLRLWFTISR